MTVRVDFERKYAAEEDPWQIGDATAERYSLVLELVRSATPGVPLPRGIDFGCGQGAFTARVAPLVREMWGVDVSAMAVARATARHPSIRFIQGDVRRLRWLRLPAASFDLAICLDVLYYLRPGERVDFLAEVDHLLREDGLAVFGGWSPGGDYLTPEEFQRLVAQRFRIRLCRILESEHVLLLASRRTRDVILSLDYETWQPVPPGRRIDWETDVLRPTAALLDVADRQGVPLTLMAELAEYYWLRRNRPAVAVALEAQLRDAVARGHDVQLHLHPEWLPELGARYVESEDAWWWDSRYRHLQDLPFPLEELFEGCRDDLEALLRPVRPTYRVVAFRAGKYRIQPSWPILTAMAAAGIVADSSVWKGGFEPEHGFDFRAAYSAAEPYWASPYQANYLAAPGEERVLELPIASYQGRQLNLDGLSSAPPIPLLRKLEREERLDALALRFPGMVRRLSALLFRSPRAMHRFLASPWRRLLFVNPAPASTLVFIGHPKAGIDPQQFSEFLSGLAAFPRVRFRRMQAVVEERQRERDLRRQAVPDRAIHASQVLRDRSAVLGEERNWRQSHYLQERLPLDRRRILDLGCGAGYWTRRLCDRVAPTVGLDVGHEFLVKARTHHRVPVVRGAFAALPFRGGAFDAVYADNCLEHAADPDRALGEVFRLLMDRGVLVAMVPPDARHAEFSGADHLWKTDGDEIEARLRGAGFTGIRIEEVDTADAFAMAPYLASANRTLVISAWKWTGGFLAERRALDLMGWLYARLSPERKQMSQDPQTILREGYAWCAGYVTVLQDLLSREGIESRAVSLRVDQHPRGRGEAGEETHEVLEVHGDGTWTVFDPTANKWLKYSLRELLGRPDLVSEALADQPQDDQFRSRGYGRYCSGWFYHRVREIAVAPRTGESLRYVSRETFLEDDPAGQRVLAAGAPATPGGLEAERTPGRGLLVPSPRVICLVHSGIAAQAVRDLSAEFGPPPPQVVPFRELRGQPGLALRLPLRRFDLALAYLGDLDAPLYRDFVLAYLWLLRAPRKALRDVRGGELVVNAAVGLRAAGRCLLDLALGPLAYGLARVRVARLTRGPSRRRAPHASRRVAYLRANLWQESTAGGSVAHTAGVLGGLKAAGLAVTYVGTTAFPPAERLGVSVVTVPPGALGLRNLPDLPFVAYSRAFTRRCLTLLRGAPPDFVYQRYSLMNTSGAEAARRLGCPFVLEYNGSEVWVARHWSTPLMFEGLAARIEEANLRAADLVVVVSRALRDDVVGRGIPAERVLVNPNAVDPAVYHPAIDDGPVRRKLGLEGKLVIGFVGTFGPWHGTEILARAVKEVAQRLPASHFLLVGDGSGMPRVRAILAEAGVLDRVTLTGLVPQAETPTYLAACDILASPHVPNPDGSPFFGSPTKLFEYMAMGKGIVASDLDQIGETLAHEKTAWLVRPGDVDALSAGIVRLAESAALRERLGAAAHAEAIRHHTWTAHVSRLLQRMRELGLLSADGVAHDGSKP